MDKNDMKYGFFDTDTHEYVVTSPFTPKPWINYLGGIVGQCSATELYAFGTDNCTYSNTERGFGDVSYNDFGAKN